MTDTALWYQNLEKPFFAPEPWVFGVAWGILYPIIIVCFGYVFYLVLRDRLPKIILWPFVINAVSNLLFSPIQFTLQNNYLALLDILVVVGSLILAMLAIWKHKKWVTIALIPYLLWGSFATILQISITILNTWKNLKF